MVFEFVDGFVCFAELCLYVCSFFDGGGNFFEIWLDKIAIVALESRQVMIRVKSNNNLKLFIILKDEFVKNGFQFFFLFHVLLFC